MASSLEHLGTTYVDSYVLHGPANGAGWSKDDREVWAAPPDAAQVDTLRLKHGDTTLVLKREGADWKAEGWASSWPRDLPS